MKLSGPDLLLIVSLLTFLVGALDVVGSMGDLHSASNGGGALAGGALVALAIINHTNKKA